MACVEENLAIILLQKDRIGSINMAYDAFEDLYKAVCISPKDISLGGGLAIAFGARGRGNAMAHYELDKKCHQHD